MSLESSLRIGWIGTGRMGYAMARRLAEGGANLVVYNRTAEKAEPLRKHGAKVVRRTDELSDCDVLFTMLSTDEALKEVLTRLSTSPALVVDCSSISIDASAEVRAGLQKKGADFLAAPVSGNPHVVERGECSFVVSGPRKQFERVRPLLLMIGRNAIYVGEEERARIAKICHNVWLGALTQALAEVTVLAEKAGLTRSAFLEFLNASALGSTYTRIKAPHWLALDFTATFTPPLMRKDMDLGLSLARELDAPMPLCTMTREIIQTQINHGYIDQDFSTLLVLQAKAAGLELKKEA